MRTKNRQQVLVIATIVVVVVWVINSLIYPSLSSYWKNRNEQVAKLRKQIEDGKRLLQRKDVLNRRWETMKKTALPQSFTGTEQLVFAAIYDWSPESEFIKAVTPQWRRDEDDYMTYQVRLECSGGLDTMTKFLHNIEKDPMALRVDVLELGSRDKDGRQLNMGIQLSFLILTLPEK